MKQYNRIMLGKGGIYADTCLKENYIVSIRSTPYFFYPLYSLFLQAYHIRYDKLAKHSEMI